jgi:stress response protein YsnF
MAERPVDSKTDMKVQLSNEEMEAINEPYVKEEVVMKKKLDTESRDVEDSAASKKFDVSTIKNDNLEQSTTFSLESISQKRA